MSHIIDILPDGPATLRKSSDDPLRLLKAALGLRPIHQQITNRVAGHLFITVLAYHLVHTIRTRLKQAKIDYSWSSLRKFLSFQVRVTVSMQCKNGSTVHVRKSTRPEPKQQEIYTAFHVKNLPGQTTKTTIRNKTKEVVP